MLLRENFNVNVLYDSLEWDETTDCYIEVRYMVTPLTTAICNGHIPCTILLIAAGADVNLQTAKDLLP